MKIKIIILLVIGIVISIMLGYLFRHSMEKTDLKPIESFSLEKADIPKIRSQIQKQMDNLGSEKTYEILKENKTSADLMLQHKVGHIFGELLYKKEGLNGIKICDNNFSFGCYHSFFSSAITDKGMGLIKDLDNVCLDKFGKMGGLGCFHGIGHGLGEYLGPKRMTEQLQACDQLSWKGPIAGCAGGVFMEYNFPLIIDGEKINSSQRLFDPKKIYSVCPEVPVKYRRACYFEIGQWWESVLNKDYKKMGEYCSELTDKTESMECFRGVGYTIGPTSKMNVDLAITQCKKMPDNNGELYCRAGAAWSFFADTTTRSQYQKLCIGFENNILEKKCLQYADVLDIGINN